MPTLGFDPNALLFRHPPGEVGDLCALLREATGSVLWRDDELTDELLLCRPLHVPDRAGWTAAGERLTERQEVDRAWLYHFDQRNGREGWARFEHGALVEMAHQRLADDEQFVRLAEDHETPMTALHRWIWSEWPVSRLVREVGLDARTWLTRPHGPLAVGGEVPGDVGGDFVHCVLDLDAALDTRLRTGAAERGTSVSKAVVDALARIAPEMLPAARGVLPRRSEVVYLPRSLYRQLWEHAKHHEVPISRLVESALRAALSGP